MRDDTHGDTGLSDPFWTGDDGTWMHRETLADDLFKRAAELDRCGDDDTRALAAAYRSIGLNLVTPAGRG